MTSLDSLRAAYLRRLRLLDDLREHIKYDPKFGTDLLKALRTRRRHSTQRPDEFVEIGIG